MNSICKMIAHKPFVQDLYVAARKRSKEIVNIGDSIRDFAYAPQRYTSESKSLCRLVLTFDAACAVLAQVPLIRGATSAEGRACLLILRCSWQGSFVSVTALTSMKLSFLQSLSGIF